MDTFKKCLNIRGAILRRASEVVAYKNWSNDFLADYMRELPALLIKQNPEFGKIHLENLTNCECDELGFGVWSDENPMRLIPLWLFPFLADKIDATCIDGTRVTRKSDIDIDNRFGLIAYGIKPSE